MIPEAIGRYQIFAQLGAGGFATVYRAYDPRLDRDVAIKVLHPVLAHDPLMRDRFLQEARALASVRHPHLVRLFDAGAVDGLVYLAMEFLSGRSLDRIALDGPLSTAEVARIIDQVAAALDALHAAGLVHRDIKPANIMVADDGRAVLVDLGVARSLATDSITSSSMVLGTPGFLAPEQLADRGAVGPRTDVYQLAATAYTLLAGRPPFAGSPAEVLYAIAHHPALDLHALCPDIPAGIAAVIAEGLAKDPRRRPASAGEFAAALSGGAQPDTLLLPQRRRPAGSPAAVTPPATAHQDGEDGDAPLQGPPRQLTVAQPALPRRRGLFRWPLAAAAAGVALILFGGSAIAVSHAQGGGADTPQVTTQEAGQQTWPAPPAHWSAGNRYRTSAKPSGTATVRAVSQR